ncbi:MAG: MurNAc alpha-1-phosphate uridylyltransferase [Candidatus Nitrotoga sp. SPKER]|nr:MAG: MurNAc alpha-1-phosphate uridylyltransferase [Candidatus Nitrotoga sp. SPKER]
MLLAAGRGERMRPLTDHTPKPLLQAGGKSLIVWHIENMAKAGICDLVINHAYLGSQIEAALGDGNQFGIRIRYSAENPVLETAGGIANALPLLGDAPFAVINSDIYCDYDFVQLPEFAAALGASGDTAHLVLVNNPEYHPNGDFGLISGRVANNTATLTFSGIGIYQPELFANIPRGTIAPLAPLLRTQIALGKVSGEHYRGRWLDVGTPQRLEKLDNELRSQHNVTHV